MSQHSKIRGLSYERRDSVAIWQIDDFEHVFEEQLEQAEAWYEEETGQDDITGSVVVFEGAPRLSSEVQEHINQAWSHLAQLVDIDRAAYVGDGISAMAVKSNVTAPGTEIEDFSSLDEAVAWAGSS